MINDNFEPRNDAGVPIRNTTDVSIPTPPTEDWKERFDRQFTYIFPNQTMERMYVDKADEVRDFISQVEAAAEARGREEAMKEAIGIMKNVLGDFKNR